MNERYYKIVDLANGDIFFIPPHKISFKIKIEKSHAPYKEAVAKLYILTDLHNAILVKSKLFENDVEFVSFDSALFINDYIRSLELYVFDPVQIVPA
jgi:hypothetical protein